MILLPRVVTGHSPTAVAAAEGKLQPVPGLPEFIDWLKANNIRRVAVSNAPKPNVEAMLKAIHLEDFFEDIMLGENFEKPKPFPDPYLAGLKIVGCQKDEVVIFEDSPAGTGCLIAAVSEQIWQQMPWSGGSGAPPGPCLGDTTVAGQCLQPRWNQLSIPCAL